MGNDKCVICGAVATKALPVTAFDDYSCHPCGTYSISRGLAAEVANAGKRFDVERTRSFLGLMRLVGDTPVITPLVISIHQLLR